MTEENELAAQRVKYRKSLVESVLDVVGKDMVKQMEAQRQAAREAKRKQMIEDYANNEPEDCWDETTTVKSKLDLMRDRISSLQFQMTLTEGERMELEYLIKAYWESL